MKWDREEEIILVDLYFKLQNTPSYNQEILIKSVSEFLNLRADLLKINKDKKFRNINGINMKIQNIEYIATNGKKGLSVYSKLDKDIFEMRVKYPEEFNQEFESIANKYKMMYTDSNKDVEVEKCVEHEILIEKKQTSAEFYVQFKKCPDEYKYIDEILNLHFPNGLRISSSIQLKKFRAKSGDKSLPAEQELLNILEKITINCGESLLMSPSSVISNSELLCKILNYVLEAFRKGKHNVYFESIYKIFKDELIYTNIYNSEILKSLIKFYFEDTFYIKRNYITDTPNIIVSVDEEVEEAVLNSDTPIRFEELADKLSHITLPKIRLSITNNLNIIRISKGTFWHITHYDITEDENNILKKIIFQKLREGFISSKKLFSIVKDELPTYIERNSIDNYICLNSLVKFYYMSEFSFQNNFIIRLGGEISASDIMKSFIEDREKFTMPELLDYLLENNLSNRYDMIEDLIGNEFIRIDQERFVRKYENFIDGNIIERVEKEISKYFVDGIIPIRKIESYILFPHIGYNWNGFLLESIIKNYGIKYTTIQLSKTINQVNSVIIEQADAVKSKW